MSDLPIHINDPDALVTAAYGGDYDLVCSILMGGANPNITNENGETALIVAAENGYDAIIEKLVKYGADINVTDNNGDTALDLAKYNNCRSTVELLKTHGAIGKDGPSAKERMMDSFYDACEKAKEVKFRDRV